MLFTTDEIEQLTENIDFFHLLFIAENCGSEVLSRGERKILKDRGIDYKKFKQQPNMVVYAYDFGKVESSIRDKNMLKKLKLADFKQFAKDNPDRILVRRADYWHLKHIKMQIYNDIKRLNNKVKTEFVEHLLENSKTQRLKVERVLRKEIKGKPVTDEIISKLNTFLAKKTKQWINHFELISSYRMQEAYSYGILADILDRYGEQAKVYFTVHQDACQWCKKVYIREKDGQPKIFYLRALINNGNNIGIKPQFYKASISPTHPRCRCKLTIYPSKTGRDIKYDPETGTYERKFN